MARTASEISMLKFNFSPFPELRSSRLLLRQLTIDDTQAVYFLRTDPTVLKYLGREPANSEAAVVEFINKINSNVESNESILWGICLIDDPKLLIGTICLWNMVPEHYRSQTGYVLHPDYWGKGYMNEALGIMLDYGFSKLGLHSIEAQLSSENASSRKVLERAGFVREGYFREDFFFREKFHDTLSYSILKQDWETFAKNKTDGNKRSEAS